MNIWKMTVEVPHGSTTRAVEATIISPPGASVLNVQELTEKAYRMATKQVTVAGVTVKVRILGGR